MTGESESLKPLSAEELDRLGRAAGPPGAEHIWKRLIAQARRSTPPMTGDGDRLSPEVRAGADDYERGRPCTCAPEDAPPLCMQRFAATECQKAFAAVSRRREKAARIIDGVIMSLQDPYTMTWGDNQPLISSVIDQLAALSKADEIAALPREEASELKADFTRSSPSGLDDATYEQIEDALDRLDAPVRAHGDRGRFLKLHERIAALPRPDTEALVEALDRALTISNRSDGNIEPSARRAEVTVMFAGERALTDSWAVHDFLIAALAQRQQGKGERAPSKVTEQ